MEGLGLMQRKLREFLRSSNGNAVHLIKYKLIIFRIAAMQHHFRTIAPVLNDNVGRSWMLVRVHGDCVAHPTEEPLTCNWLMEGFSVPAIALLTQRHPHTPEERFFYSVNWDLQHRTNEAICAFLVGDSAEVFREHAHLRLLLFRQTSVVVRRAEANAGRPLVNLTATPAFEGEDCSHGAYEA